MNATLDLAVERNEDGAMVYENVLVTQMNGDPLMYRLLRSPGLLLGLAAGEGETARA